MIEKKRPLDGERQTAGESLAEKRGKSNPCPKMVGKGRETLAKQKRSRTSAERGKLIDQREESRFVKKNGKPVNLFRIGDEEREEEGKGEERAHPLCKGEQGEKKEFVGLLELGNLSLRRI